MLASESGVADDGVAVDLDQPSGGPDSVSLVEVFQEGECLLRGQLRAEEGGSLAFGEASLATPTVEEATLLVLAIASTNGEVSTITLAESRTLFIEATESGQVVGHGGSR